jgi:hypothetical protein
MHTHFGSATHLASTFLGVLVAGTFWRLAWLHAMTVNNKTVQGLAKAALAQY